MFPRPGPKTLGRLISLYERKVFVQSVIWGINGFVQLGGRVGEEADLRALLDQFRKWRA